MKELRSYLFLLITKLIKVIHQLDRKSPHIKTEILEMIIEEIAKSLRKIIQKNHRSFDTREIAQIWVEVEFFEKFISGFPSENLKKCYHNLRKIWSKLKGFTKLASESDIFPKDLQAAKDSLLNSELTKAKLLQSCLVLVRT